MASESFCIQEKVAPCGEYEHSTRNSQRHKWAIEEEGWYDCDKEEYPAQHANQRDNCRPNFRRDLMLNKFVGRYKNKLQTSQKYKNSCKA